MSAFGEQFESFEQCIMLTHNRQERKWMRFLHMGDQNRPWIAIYDFFVNAYIILLFILCLFGGLVARKLSWSRNTNEVWLLKVWLFTVYFWKCRFMLYEKKQADHHVFFCLFAIDSDSSFFSSWSISVDWPYVCYFIDGRERNNSRDAPIPVLGQYWFQFSFNVWLYRLRVVIQMTIIDLSKNSLTKD